MFAGLIAATALTLMPVEKPEPVAPVALPVAELALSINKAVAAIDVQNQEPAQSPSVEVAKADMANPLTSAQ